MQTVGNITGYVDLAQILLYVFWIFFACSRRTPRRLSP
ncbi:MAG: Photosynthetic reaction centre, H-chain N-terminal region [Pseudomonadota bacterium]